MCGVLNSADKTSSEVAKGNTDADLRTRAEAVGDYAGNKMDQKSSEV